MAQAPIMPLFTDALIGDTTHLSTEQFGAYVLILIATWRNNGRALPDDDKQLANVCRVGLWKWRKKLRPLLIQFFSIDEAGWHQKRLEIEWERVSDIIAKRRANGTLGGRASAAAKHPPNGGSKTIAIHNQREASLPKKDSSTRNTESLNRAREEKKINEEESFERPAGALEPRSDGPIMETPARVVLTGANRGGTSDGTTSLPSPAADNARLDRKNLGVKTRMPARRADRHRDGECDELPSQTPAPDHRDLARECQDHANPIAGGGQSVTVGLSRRGFHCRPPPKSPALKALIKQQLQAKHCRYLTQCAPDEVGSYWAALLDDDPAVAQRALDAVDARMRAAQWDDMRQWKAQHGIAA